MINFFLVNNRKMIWCILLICSGFLISPQINAQTESDPIQAGTDELEKLEQQEASLLAPKSYAKAIESYQRYVNMIRDGRPEKEIQETYSLFKESLHKTLSLMNQTKNILTKALSARRQAIDAKAPVVAEKEYQQAENKLSNAIEKVEDNKLSESDKLGQEAVLLYRNVEIMALKISLIGKVKSKLSQAKANNANELTPITYNQTVLLINEIETALEKGSGITPDTRKKAAKAEYEADRTLFLTQRIDTLRRDNKNWELLLLEQENILSNLASIIEYDYRFDQDGNSLINETSDIIAGYKDSLRTEIAGRDDIIEKLHGQIDSLKQDYKTQQIRLASRIEEYQTDLQTRKEELEKRRRDLDEDLHTKMILDAVQQAQNRFERKEAIVLREANEVIIRIVGLTFAPSKTSIPPSALPILDKLASLVVLYPDADILIEGHTDSSGKEDKNIQYSETRAASVRDYLLNTHGMDENQIKHQGFGSSKPIATNKSRRGRTQNRRIDVVIDFNNVEPIGTR